MSVPDGGGAQLITRKQLLRQVRVLLFDVREHYQQVIERNTGEPVTCQRGCAYCCYPKVVVGAAEGALLYLYIKEHHMWSDELERRLIESDREMTAADHAEHHAKRRPCVFLREEAYGRGSCTVYPVRPMACTTMFSIEKDPTACGVVGGRALVSVASEGVTKVFSTMYSSLLRGLRETRCWLFTLPGAVLYARARIDGLPLPAVHHIDRDLIPDSVESAFDRSGKAGEVEPWE